MDYFKRNSKNDGNRKEAQMNAGSFEGMLKMRKEKKSEMEETIQRMLDNWDGSSIALFVAKEDENGDVIHVNKLMTGVSQPATHLRVARELHSGSHELIEMIIDQLKEHPELAKDILKEVIDLIGE